jgi:hypothetical protein
MKLVREKLGNDKSPYRRALLRILSRLENTNTPEPLADAITSLAELAAGLHDLGKGDLRWQAEVRKLVPEFAINELIGRTAKRGPRLVPHTPPAFPAIMRASELLLGDLNAGGPLVRAIALAAARHHSALLNPALMADKYTFQPLPELERFIESILKRCHAPPEFAKEILRSACVSPAAEAVPLMLPNDDLFPVYALVGRAILMSDREDAAGHYLESR